MNNSSKIIAKYNKVTAPSYKVTATEYATGANGGGKILGHTLKLTAKQSGEPFEYFVFTCENGNCWMTNVVDGKVKIKGNKFWPCHYDTNQKCFSMLSSRGIMVTEFEKK